MIDRHTLLKRLDTVDGDEVLSRIKACLELDETRIVAGRSTKVSVSEALRLWTTRLKNTDITGQQLDGAEALVHKLKELAKQRKLEQIAFSGPTTGGNVFFQATSPKSLVGAIVFQLPKHARE